MQKNNMCIQMIDTYNILPCPFQTRKIKNSESLQQLVESVKENGILQPLTATKEKTGYQLISGHRRLVAAKVLKIDKVPVIIVKKTELEIAVLCTIENLHREDLNFFEQAEAIALLIDTLGLTQSEAGVKLSLTQPAIANKLKLLQLEENQRKLILESKLTERHARAVIRIEREKRQAVIDYIIKHNLNVNATDRYVDGILNKKEKHKQKTIIHIKDVRLFTNTLTKAVSIMKMAGFKPIYEQNNTEGGIEYKIVIPYIKKQESENSIACQSGVAVNI